LLAQTWKAATCLHPRSILLVGGVACNSLLRRTFKEAFEEKAWGEDGLSNTLIRVYYPSPILTTDNGAMIAAAGAPKLSRPSPMELDLNASADLRLC
jgi:N6-L-threonylcarbamoyladenine synthase